MRLLLVTIEQGWSESLRTLFPADDVIAISVPALQQNPALGAAAEACLVAEAQASPWAVDTLKQLSATIPAPLFLLTDGARSQWEEAALFAGAEQIFRRPLKAAIVQLAISRLQRRRSPEPAANPAPRPMAEPRPESETSTGLLAWRDFSRVLAEYGNAAAFAGAYLARLRDVLGANRVLLYTADPTTRGAYHCGWASGVDRREFQFFRLALSNGLAQLVSERGTAIWQHRLRTDGGRESAAAREMAVFGGEVALPIGGSSGLAGILILGRRVSGPAYSESDVATIYQAIEPLGTLLVSNADLRGWTGESDAVLQAMPVAAAIVSRDLRIVATNPSFRSIAGGSNADKIEFAELPSAWSTAIAEAVQSETAVAPTVLEHHAIGTPRKVRVSVVPMGDKLARRPLFLLTVEDIVPPSPHDSDPHGIANLLQRAGEQLSNEFRNALTPVDIMVQLSHDTSTTRVELEQLSTQVSTAIHRLRRRIDDLAYLTKSAIIPERTTVSAVLRATRERLDEWVGVKQLKRVVWLNEFSETELMADGRALAVALGELVMNALEACDGKQVTVTAEDAAETVSFRVRNNGVWAPPAESSGFRHRPFVSSKSTGVGLGIEVATRVAENHGGRLIVGPTSADVVEAIVRIPRGARPVATPRIESGVVRVHSG